MKYLYWIFICLAALTFEAAMSSYLVFLGYKVDFVLLVLMILMLRWKSSSLIFIGAGMGLMCDALSHSMLGVYGISYLLTMILARSVGEWFYDENVFSTLLFAGVLTIAEGSIALIFFKTLMPWMSWNSQMLGTVLPLAAMHALVSPIILAILLRLERLFHVTPNPHFPSLYRG